MGRGSSSKKLKRNAKISVYVYPQLKQLAWQLKKSTEVTPKEALRIYERSWRHIATILQALDGDLLATERLIESCAKLS